MLTKHHYDPAGRLVKVVLPEVADPENNNTLTSPTYEYEYEPNGQQSIQRDAKQRETIFAYDHHGRRTSRTLPAVSNQTVAEQTTYDALGRISTHSDFKGQITAYFYDNDTTLGLPFYELNLGRLIEERRYTDAGAYNNGAGTPAETTRYTYDDLGRQSLVREYDGPYSGSATPVRSTSYGYDPVTGNIAAVTSPEGIINYEYDEATGRHTRTYTSDNDTSYGYDELGRLKTVEVAKLNGTTLTSPQVTTYAYDDAGNLDSITNDNATASTSDDLKHQYTYDALHRLTDLNVTWGGTSVFSQTYILASDGQRDSVTEVRGNVTTLIDWEYDALNRLISETRDVGNDGQDDENYIATFTLDLVGNRLSKVFNSADNAKDETIAYSYNDRDQLTSEVSSIYKNSVTYAYDHNGSTTLKSSSGTDTLYGWDLRNRMTSTVGSTTTEYAYDHEHQRVSQQTGTDPQRRYLNDKNNPTGYPQILEEWSGTTLQRSYVLGLQVHGQGDNVSFVLHFVRDGHGSNRAVIDLSGLTLEEYDYQGFGEAIGFDPAGALTIHLFGGDSEYDPTSSFYYHDRRWRQTHRFISFDDFDGMASRPLSFHKYLYASHNPPNLDDASGRYFGFESVWAMNFGLALDVRGASVARSYMELQKGLSRTRPNRS